MAKFTRVTKKKTDEEIEFTYMRAKLATWADLRSLYDGGEVCPAEDVGKPLDEVLFYYTN
jgi:hypothetical protein